MSRSRSRHRLDVDAIARQIASERARRGDHEQLVRAARADRRSARLHELERRIDVPYAPQLEGRLLAAILCEREVLELCSDVEVDDFGDLRHRAVFASLRNVLARSDVRPWSPAAVLDAVADELELADARDGKHLSDSVDDMFLAELVCRHLHEAYGPPGSPIAEWVLHDAAQLRQLANRRRAL